MFAQRENYVLGIDPGLTRCGYAVLQVVSANEVKMTALGVLRTKPENDLSSRLAEIAAEINDLLDEYQPTAVAVEQIFFQSNVRSAMSVGQVSGLVLSAAANRGVQVAQYSPNQVKLAITGWGGADKAQVQKMVKQRLKLNSIPKPADAADAAAIALCHIASSPLAARIAESMAGKK
ncbi:MAG: crossover junction endodeoxyribonuclease RuvC [Actinobacteria bacterium]|jgi:crossover junction endodeoxyribonuclease RuvC|nr:crossover junction endodeoxyribonuclease RuvC [Actinomycetota bacterium]NCU80466.1 crossover junction endodeoxyribonuclease RuvC [Acidimicrobiia bacterium]NDC99126.1 crossover junction endodeoxyribonuclease RuvC [bacterium]HBQ51884.1 crossover junction endodeoxyribonuclease RuvC [Acidimicrobium sp.]NBO97109.1 crossover junction endodeoxyribonuclease RuvC [Actinomycetota bacterium]